MRFIGPSHTVSVPGPGYELHAVRVGSGPSDHTVSLGSLPAATDALGIIVSAPSLPAGRPFVYREAVGELRTLETRVVDVIEVSAADLLVEATSTAGDIGGLTLHVVAPGSAYTIPASPAMVHHGRRLDAASGSAPQRWVDYIDATSLQREREVSLNLPAGHGLSRAAVVRKAALASGWPSDKIALRAAGAYDGEIIFADRPWWDVASELMAAAGRALHVDRVGVLRNPYQGAAAVERGSSIAALRIDDYPGLAVSLTFTRDAPTLLALSADIPADEALPVDPETGLKACPPAYSETIRTTYGPRSTRVASQEQPAASGPSAPALSATGFSSVHVPAGSIEEVVAWSIRECGVVVKSGERRYGWMVRRQRRKLLDSTGTPSQWYQGYLYSDTGEVLHADPGERWSLLSESVTDRLFVDTKHELDRVRVWGWRLRAAAAKSRTATADPTSQDWSSRPWNAVYDLGDGTLVVEEVETFHDQSNPDPLQLTVRTMDEAEGYETGFLEQNYGYHLPPGQMHLYQDGAESSSASEVYGLTGYRTVFLVEEGAGHRRIESEYDSVGRLIRGDTTIERDYLPALARQFAPGTPPPSASLDAEEAAEYGPPPTGAVLHLTHECRPADGRGPDLEERVAFIGSPEELSRLCGWRAEDLAAATFTLTLPPWVSPPAASLLWIKAGSSYLAAYVEEVEIRAEGAGIEQRVSGRLYR